MKEDDPKKPLFTDEDGPQSEDEWSPFFEELEGVEFEVDSPLDLDDTVWDEAKPPKPPASPFAGARTDDDEFFFDSDRDNELFGASFDDEMPEDATWASSPMEDAPFFEDKPGKRGGRLSPLDEFGADDELFSTTAGPGSRGKNEGLFSEDELFSNANVSEADETIFLPPDEREKQAMERTPRSMDRKAADAAPAVPLAGGAHAAASRTERRPYERRRSSAGGAGLLWAGLIGLFVLVAGGGYAYMQGMLPFGPGASPAPREFPTASTTPPTAETPPAVDPGTTPVEDPAAASTPGATNPTPTSPTPTTPTPAAQTPETAAPRGFVGASGGWTIVVSSRESVAEAEALLNRYGQVFANQGFPVDILRTDDFGTPRYRVGVGQFTSIQAATAAMGQHSASLPTDAWVTSIPR